MGIGLRDHFIGPFLRIHLAGGGVEKFIKNYSQSYRYRWETMCTWTSIPESAIEKIIDGVKNLKMVQEKRFEEIENWRDKMLLKLINLLTS